MENLNYSQEGDSQPSSGSGSARMPHDFFKRSEQNQNIFTHVTWCDSCLMNDLGMIEPKEYDFNGKRFLEGKCYRCGSNIVSEIIRRENDGVEDEIIWPIRDGSKPALTYIPRYDFDTFVQRGPSKYSFARLGTPIKRTLGGQIVLWVIIAMIMLVGAYSIFKDLIYGH